MWFCWELSQRAGVFATLSQIFGQSDQPREMSRHAQHIFHKLFHTLSKTLRTRTLDRIIVNISTTLLFDAQIQSSLARCLVSLMFGFLVFLHEWWVIDVFDFPHLLFDQTLWCLEHLQYMFMLNDTILYEPNSHVFTFLVMIVSPLVCTVKVCSFGLLSDVCERSPNVLFHILSRSSMSSLCLIFWRLLWFLTIF